jgi:DNA repair exonuclease SbcCD nuclease subunit
MSKPIAVLIGDIHYNINTLLLADKAMRMAVEKANTLQIPLVVVGDLHDTKANMRGECVNAMLDTFAELSVDLNCYILVGNHDKINEKSDEHSLNFLRDRATIVDLPCKLLGFPDNFRFVPYYSDADELRTYLKAIPKGSTLIMHQGIQGSNSGEYYQDKSALKPEDVAGMRVISGHYHARQTIELPDDGKWDYVGNPYTLTYGEANDPEKGFQILHDDGSLEFVPTNLRRHIILDVHVTQVKTLGEHAQLLNKNNLWWIKIRGANAQLSGITRRHIECITKMSSFKLDLIPTDTTTNKNIAVNVSQDYLLDSIIDSLTNTNYEQKQRLKIIWKDLM